jgi:uncharacterized repeat protein (TIGR02543 family)
VEFLATYSWAILIIAISVAAIYLILFSSKGSSAYVPSSCYITPLLPCYQTVLMANSSGSKFIALIQNNMGVTMYFNANSIYVHPSFSSNAVYTGSCLPQKAPPGATVICNVTIASSAFTTSVGSQLNPTFTLNYQICPSCNSANSQSYNTIGTATLTVSPFDSAIYNVQLLTNTGTGNVVVSGVSYPSGANVVFIAGVNYPIYATLPSSAYSFVGWQLSNVIVANSLQQSTTATNGTGRSPASIQANFAMIYNVSTYASPAGDGTVTGGGLYDSGQTATISETPTAGYSFTGWSCTGSASSACPSGTQTSFSFTVTGSATVTANFALIYTVSTYASPAGDGTVSGGGSYNSGATATISETPATGYSFTGWTCTGSAASLCPSGTQTSFGFTVTGAATVTANYQINSYTVSTYSSPTGSGTVTGGGSYNYGQTATISETPAAGYAFTGWACTRDASSACPSGTGTTQFSFTVSSGAAVTASYQIISYTVSTYASPAGDGTVSGGGSYNSGQTATISETPAAGYAFTGWACSGSASPSCPSGISTTSFSFTVTSTASVTASYSIIYLGNGGNCASAGGTMNQGVCEFAGSQCPPSWAPYYSWSATSGGTLSCPSSDLICNPGSCSPSGNEHEACCCLPYCTVSSHSFSNTSVESCYSYCPAGSCGTLSATEVDIGCYTGSHTSPQCSALGGTVMPDGYGYYFCEFSGSSCPPNWTKYYYWSATSPSSGSGPDETLYGGGGNYCAQSGNCRVGQCGSGDNSCCTTGSHTFANISTETCTYWYSNDAWQYPAGERCDGCTEVTVGASVTAIGCI